MKKKITFLAFILPLFLISQNSIVRPWATYIGGTGIEGVPGNVNVDHLGNIYICGTTKSPDSIATTGTYQSSISNGCVGLYYYNAYIIKLDSSGNKIWGTYFGTYCSDTYGNSCSVDSLGNIFLVGYAKDPSSSPTPLTTTGAHQETYGGGTYDSFLAKFDSTGNLHWSTYYGGNNRDRFTSCSLDQYGNIYATGWSKSNNNISSSLVHQQNNEGGYDAILAKFNTTGTLIWGTYFGGNADDRASTCKVFNNSIIISGTTASQNNIADSSSYNEIYAGGVSDGFISKFDLNGMKKNSTYYGGLVQDGIYDIDIDQFENLYVVGYTSSDSSISTPFSYQSVKDADINNPYDGFLCKFDSTFNLQWGTYIGGTHNDYIYSCNVDDSSNVYLTGSTISGTGLISSNSFQNSYGGGSSDGFIFKFDSSGQMKWNSYYGGSSQDWGQSITTDNNFNIYLFGNTSSFNNIATPNALQPTANNFAGENFLAKFNTFYCSYSSYSINQTSCSLFLWDGITYDSTGQYTNTYSDINGCDSIVTLDLTILTGSSSTMNVTECDSYAWDGVTYDSTGQYTNTYTDINGCDSIITLDLTINNSSLSTVTITACNSFDWDGVTYDSTGQYTNTYSGINGCDSIATLDLTINNSSSSTVTITACNSFDWDGVTYDATGTYSNIYTDVYGCDSTVTLDLSIVESPTVIINLNSNGDDLIATVTGGTAPYTYSWINLPISNSPNYGMPLSTGLYWVIVTDNFGCVSDTATYNYTSTSTDEFNFKNITVYPNPTNNFVMISNTYLDKNIKTEIYNSVGKRLNNTTGNFVDLNNYSKGIYFLKVIINQKVKYFKIIKK